MRLFYTFLLSSLFWGVACTTAVENNDKKVFRCNQANVTSLDPAFANTLSNWDASSQIFNGLIELDKDLNVKTCLAKSWELSEDLKTYTFILHDNIYFHDHHLFPNGKGRKVTAYDFEYSLKRIVDTTDIYNKGIWVYKDKVLKNSNGTISDTCFKAVNDSTFKIYLQSPYPHFIEILSMPYGFVVPKEIAEHYGRDFRRNPIGTGPFCFKEWDEGNTLILLKNKNYFREGYPKLDAVQMYFIGDKSQEFRMFMMGKLDYATSLDENSRDEVIYLDGSIKENMKEKYHVNKIPYLTTTYLGMQLDKNAPCYKDMPDHPLLNKKFRQALNYAINKERLVTYLQNSLGESGHHGVVPNCIPNFNARKVKGYTYQPELALKLLNESGADFKKYPLVLSITKQNKSLGEYLLKQWEEILGVQVKVEILDGGMMIEKSDKGELPFFRAGWIADYPNAENFLALFYGPNEAPLGPNRTRYKNETYDKMYRQSKFETSTEDRAVIFQQMDSIMIQEAPIIPLYHSEILQLQQKNIQNLEPNSLNLLHLERVDKE